MVGRAGCLRCLPLFALFAVASCNRGPDNSQTPPAPPPAEVQTVTLAPRPIPRTSEFVATIRSLRSTTIQPQVEGFVREILVKAGQRVHAGQPLVQIDPDLQQAAAVVTESQRGAREADLVLARQQLERARKLHEAGAISRASLDEAETTYETADAQLKALQSQIRENEVQLHYYRVTAPGAGVLGDIPIRRGDRVTPSTIITTIDQSEALEVYMNVPLEQAAAVRLQMPVEIVNADGTVAASTAVSFIAPRADDATQSVLVKAALRMAPPSLRLMQYVRARIVWSNEPGLAVPVVAVNRLAGQHFVFVVEEGDQGAAARQKPVTLGEVIGNEYVVRGGVEAGERVIVSNLQKIGDGAPVKPSS
jgi:RND family efflux transporter MFP subunit